ncbi:glycosyltransferase family 2 protein [Aquirufa sp. ROCK-SH2]
MHSNPLISVIIPTYNRINVVGNAIKSVLNQTYSNIELIVVDDGSTDGTQKLIATFPEVIYISKANGGQASARNVGLKHANGKFIASLDSDDFWEEQFLEKMIASIEEHQLDFVFANWQQQHDRGNYFEFLSKYKYLPSHLPRTGNVWVHLDSNDLRQIYLAGCASPSSSLLIRAKTLKKRGWNEQMNITDDWCMLLDIIFNEPTRAAYTTEPLWIKNVYGDNIYDGRSKVQLLRLLVLDNLNLIKRNKPLLSPSEMKVLQKEYILNLMNVSKETFVRDKDVKKSLSFMLRAFSDYPKYSFTIFCQLICKVLQNKRLHKADIS